MNTLEKKADEVSNRAATRPTVLVVDDEPMVLKVTSKLLESMGYHAVTASSGEQAIAFLSSLGTEKAGLVETVYLVILDIGMPGMEGPECFEKIRKLMPDLPISISSGDPSDPRINALSSKGHVKVLSKPFSADELESAVRWAIDIVT